MEFDEWSSDWVPNPDQGVSTRRKLALDWTAMEEQGQILPSPGRDQVIAKLQAARGTIEDQETLLSIASYERALEARLKQYSDAHERAEVAQRSADRAANAVEKAHIKLEKAAGHFQQVQRAHPPDSPQHSKAVTRLEKAEIEHSEALDRQKKVDFTLLKRSGMAEMAERRVNDTKRRLADLRSRLNNPVQSLTYVPQFTDGD
jgi:hypothetical protein